MGWRHAPARSHSSAMIMVAPGSLSEGLTMSVFPDHQRSSLVPLLPRSPRFVDPLKPSHRRVAFQHILKLLTVRAAPINSPDSPVTVASAADHSTIIAGKLNGVIAAVTPRGSLLEYVSMSLATSSLSPNNVDVMAVAVSTTWRPRPTSPWASAKVLPCSRTMDLAMSWECCRMRCCSLEEVSAGAKRSRLRRDSSGRQHASMGASHAPTMVRSWEMAIETYRGT